MIDGFLAPPPVKEKKFTTQVRCMSTKSLIKSNERRINNTAKELGILTISL